MDPTAIAFCGLWFGGGFLHSITSNNGGNRRCVIREQQGYLASRNAISITNKFIMHSGAQKQHQSFRTEISMPPILSPPIQMNDTICVMGSCFSENIGDKLKSLKFHVDLNPFGIIYNPVSLADSLIRILDPVPFTPDDLSFDGEKWFSFSHHSSFSSADANVCIGNINQRLFQAHRNYQAAKIVANCHKQPANLFEKEILDVEFMESKLSEAVRMLLQSNTGLKIVLTVSPVRHWKDSAVGNSLSKASLIVLAHALIKRFPKRVSYFGAYEVMMDDLRDYRFYAPDMLHPSPTAVEYIWCQLMQACFSPQCTPVFAKLDALHAALHHRPFDARSVEYRTFLQRQLHAMDQLSAIYPHVHLPFPCHLPDPFSRSPFSSTMN